jgi:hypothetical protein
VAPEGKEMPPQQFLSECIALLLLHGAMKCPLKQFPDKSRDGFQFEGHYIYEMDVNTGQDIGYETNGKSNL